MIGTGLPAPRRALAALPLLLAFLGSHLAAQEPTALSVSPALPTTDDALLLVLSGFGCAPQLAAPQRGGETILWSGSSVQCIHATYWRTEAKLEPLPAGAHRAQVVVDGQVAAELDFGVRLASQVLLLHGGRFRATLSWQNPYGPGGGQAQAVGISDQAGYFWFGGPRNPEVTLKVLDGRAINGRFWVFASSLTTVDFDLVVFDIGDGTCLANHDPQSALSSRSSRAAPSHPAHCPQRRYQQARNRNRNFFDFQAFLDPGEQ
jgi:hypothetical protein